MRRISLWLLSTVSAVVLIFGYHTSTQGALSAGGATTATFSGSLAGTAAGSGEDPTSSTTTSGSGTGGTGDTGDTGDGTGSGSSGTSSSGGGTSSATTATLTGDVVNTRWGPVQVELTTSGGSITDVSVLQYPQGNHEDEQINSYALPILIDETLQAQSADIDMVSGATVTSEGYLGSLQSALDQAR